MLDFLFELFGGERARPNPPADYVLPAYKLMPSRFDPGRQADVQPGDPRPLEQDLIELLGRNYAAGTGARTQVLLLSGGSQHGSFGAGLFNGMAAVPDYDIVTGVSTGSLQSTFIFLANRPVPADRIYPEYMRRQGDFAEPGQSSVADLALAYRVENETDLLKVGGLGMIGALFNGSAAHFLPLRRTLLGLISEGTLRAIATESEKGRKLFAGLANVDDGFGYAIDLTQIACDAVATGKFLEARRAYVEVLIASSSVPPGVPPVSLTFSELTHEGRGPKRTDMFIDGGARYGVFFSQLHNSSDLHGGTDMDLIVNGFLHGKEWVGKSGGRVKKWNALNLALRAVDLMENQVYRLSVGDAERWAVDNGRLRMAFISHQELQHITTPPLEWRYKDKSCAEWKRVDAKRFKPMEFYPNYMKSIVDYGEHRGARDPWNNDIAPKNPPKP